jgi:hypothetical protein
LERTLPPLAVGDPAAGILIEAVEQVFGASVEAYGNDGCAQRLQVLGDELPPEVLAQSHGEHGERHGRGIAVEREIAGHLPSTVGRGYTPW